MICFRGSKVTADAEHISRPVARSGLGFGQDKGALFRRYMYKLPLENVKFLQMDGIGATAGQLKEGHPLD